MLNELRIQDIMTSAGISDCELLTASLHTQNFVFASRDFRSLTVVKLKSPIFTLNVPIDNLVFAAINSENDLLIFHDQKTKGSYSIFNINTLSMHKGLNLSEKLYNAIWMPNLAKYYLFTAQNNVLAWSPVKSTAQLKKALGGRPVQCLKYSGNIMIVLGENEIRTIHLEGHRNEQFLEIGHTIIQGFFFEKTLVVIASNAEGNTMILTIDIENLKVIKELSLEGEAELVNDVVKFQDLEKGTVTDALVVIQKYQGDQLLSEESEVRDIKSLHSEASHGEVITESKVIPSAGYKCHLLDLKTLIEKHSFGVKDHALNNSNLFLRKIVKDRIKKIWFDGIILSLNNHAEHGHSVLITDEQASHENIIGEAASYLNLNTPEDLIGYKALLGLLVPLNEHQVMIKHFNAELANSARVAHSISKVFESILQTNNIQALINLIHFKDGSEYGLLELERFFNQVILPLKEKIKEGIFSLAATQQDIRTKMGQIKNVQLIIQAIHQRKYTEALNNQKENGFEVFIVADQTFLDQYKNQLQDTEDLLTKLRVFKMFSRESDEVKSSQKKTKKQSQVESEGTKLNLKIPLKRFNEILLQVDGKVLKNNNGLEIEGSSSIHEKLEQAYIKNVDLQKFPKQVLEALAPRTMLSSILLTSGDEMIVSRGITNFDVFLKLLASKMNAKEIIDILLYYLKSAACDDIATLVAGKFKLTPLVVQNVESLIICDKFVEQYPLKEDSQRLEDNLKKFLYFFVPQLNNKQTLLDAVRILMLLHLDSTAELLIENSGFKFNSDEFRTLIRIMLPLSKLSNIYALFVKKRAVRDSTEKEDNPFTFKSLVEEFASAGLLNELTSLHLGEKDAKSLRLMIEGQNEIEDKITTLLELQDLEGAVRMFNEKRSSIKSLQQSTMFLLKLAAAESEELNFIGIEIRNDAPKRMVIEPTVDPQTINKINLHNLSRLDESRIRSLNDTSEQRLLSLEHSQNRQIIDKGPLAHQDDDLRRAKDFTYYGQSSIAFNFGSK
jgi:hypothetical protein